MLSPLPRRSDWRHCFAHSPSRVSLPRYGCRVGLRIVLFEMLWGGGEEIASIVADVNRWSPPMQKPNDLNQSRIVLKQDSTLIAVIEMSLSSWLVAGIVPGVERQPLKKLAVDESALLKLLNRWREEAEKAGCRIERIAVAFEAGRDGFWLARWLRARGIEAHVIHASSVAVSREHRRAKTDRLDTELLKRAFLGWLRGERDHCKMVAIPTTKDEDAKRPNRERESLVGEQTRIVNRMKAALIRLGIRGFNPKLKKAAGRLEELRTPEDEPIPPNTLAELRRDMERRRLVSDQIRQIEEARLDRLKQAPGEGPHAMVRLLARVIGVGIETADMLVQEVLSRNMRDRRAIARYAGLTGSPDDRLAFDCWLLTLGGNVVSQIKAGARRPNTVCHFLRHTWASHAVMNSVPVMVVAKNLGHASAWSRSITGIWHRASSPMPSGRARRATGSRMTSEWCRCGSQFRPMAKTLRSRGKPDTPG